jgi:hypothetical protein
MRIAADPLTNWGTTFHALEQKAGRVTTRFADGSAVAERGMDGHIRTWLYNAAGNEIATLHAEQSGSMRLDLLGATTLNTVRRPGLIPTLSWANEQAYALAKDDASGLQWRGEVLRGRGSPQLPTEIEVEFEGGITAKTMRYPDGYQTALYLHGTSVGRMRYKLKERELIFQFPGLTEGVLTSDKQKIIGGWRFTPTLAWMHVQALAFYQFHSAVKAKGVARAEPTWFMKPELKWFQKAWEAVFPTVQAQDGCTGLHWLDGTLFRPCCDIHDQCYIKYGCDRYSWRWPASYASWSCLGCNTFAMLCFVVGGPVGGGTGENLIWYPTPV